MTRTVIPCAAKRVIWREAAARSIAFQWQARPCDFAQEGNRTPLQPHPYPNRVQATAHPTRSLAMTAVAVSSHALPESRPHESPSSIRIGALSIAITTNLAFFLVLSLARMDAPPAPPLMEEVPVQIVEFVRTPPPPVLPPPPMPQVPVRPVQPPTTVAPPQPVPAPIPTPTQPIWVTAPVSVTNTVPESVSDAVPGPAVAALRQLAILESSRPPYPPREVRMRHEGEVLLRIRIGADGRPMAVEVERSSGYAALDQSAARHVMRTWRFVPPGGDGRAIGLLPVRFSLQ